LETADAIASLKREDVLFVIVGDFQDSVLKTSLLKKTGVDYFFLGNQPFEMIPDIAAAGDYCVLLQDAASPVTQFQVPAKLSDALGMGLVILANDLLPLSDIVAQGAVVTITRDNLPQVLAEIIKDESKVHKVSESGLVVFAAEMTFAANAPRLHVALAEGPKKGAGEFGTAKWLGALLEGTRLSILLSEQNSQVPQANQIQQPLVMDLSTAAERIDIVVPVYNALEDVKKMPSFAATA